jgi:DNA helicase-2/ATP-dependent DNA helicase PcrA
MTERDADAGETREYRIFGPPGTGKTTNLSRQIQRAAEKYGASALLVTSFSRAAAAELAGRDLPIPKDRIGTLHSHCWHALGGPKIAEANVQAWNQERRGLEITSQNSHGKLDGDTDGAGESGAREGDELLAELNRWRGMIVPRAVWPLRIAQFEEAWSDYKRANELLDFTDLIEIALRDLPFPPGRASVIFADEAQDLNPMQLKLIRRWGDHAEYFIVAGDDDQTIYTFTGASPEAFLDPDIPQSHKIILKQSYRVPRAVHRLANAMILRVTRRQPKEYLPREADGAVERLELGTFREPDPAFVVDLRRQLEEGKSVMVLATCSYMLSGIISALRENAIPFYNPYRKSNGFWNPLRFGSRGATPNRILALLSAHPDFGPEAREWTNGDLALWAEHLRSQGILKHGAKKTLQAVDLEAVVTYERLDELFEPAALEELLGYFEGGYQDLLAWWKVNLTTDAEKRAEFPVRIAAQHGARGLLDTPKVIVGTIHSVKGGEADCVYVFPDLSRAGDAQYQSVGPLRDSVTRLFYVAATRAKERLVICPPATPRAISI